MIISLDGEWRIAVDPENVGREQQWGSGPARDAQPIRVPGIIQEVFPGYHGVAWFWRSFDTPVHPHPEGRLLLRFGAVDYQAEVWVNDQKVGEHEGGETPFVLDVTGAVRPGGQNDLAVRALNPTREPLDGIVLRETPHRNKTIPLYPGSAYNYGGIIEPVELLLVPAVYVEDLSVHADPETGLIRTRIEIRNAADRAVHVHLRLSVAPEPAGASLPVESRTLDLPSGVTLLAMDLRVERPHLWDLHDPFLYRVSAQLQSEPSPSFHERSVRCGFRDFRVVNGYFRLNGRRLFLRSTHTGNHCPVGQVNAPAAAPDLLRRDLLYAKTLGFNMVRFIAGLAHPWQLDCCDELGLMVYEECAASWCLADSPRMAERFDQATADMIRRDRNHPSVVIWGLLNETPDGPVFRHAVASLPLVRSLDESRLVLLGSGRWDNQAAIGSLSNPGSLVWEHQWGEEAPGAPPVASVKSDCITGEINPGMGDFHIYPRVPQDEESMALLRTLGENGKPVFLSEYGIGSLMNAIRELHFYEQSGENPAVEDAVLTRSMAERFAADWERYGMDGVYAFPEEMLRESQRLHSRQRRLAFDLVRANPKICGYNLTGMLDHAMTGEGLWSFWRELKPEIADVLLDGWAPLRWCLFVSPLHAYAGQKLTLEAVLANEDVLGPGEYPARFRLMGPEGVAWERRTPLRIPRPAGGGAGPLAVPVLREEVELNGPAGAYEFAAAIEAGAAPAGGRRRFYLSDAAALPRVDQPVTLWGVDPAVEAWLRHCGIDCHSFESGLEKPNPGYPPQVGERVSYVQTGVSTPGNRAARVFQTRSQPSPERREVILIGSDDALAADTAGWRDLARRMARGSVAVFVSPAAFRRHDSQASPGPPLLAGEGPGEASGWLPLREKGRCEPFFDWLYHKECVARPHPFFDGLPASGIMDWDYYGPVIPRRLFTGQPAPDEVAAAAFAIGYPCPGGYRSGLLAGVYRWGEGRFFLNTCRVLENLGVHPAADRLLLNMLRHAASFTTAPLAPIPPHFEAQLREIGYS